MGILLGVYGIYLFDAGEGENYPILLLYTKMMGQMGEGEGDGSKIILGP